MEIASQIFASGLVTGSIFALVALGFTLVYSATGLVNFAAGEFVMMGGIVMAQLVALYGVPVPLAVPLAIAFVAILGAVMDRFALRQARQPTPVTLIMITIGIGIAFRGLTMLVAGKSTFLPPGLPGLPQVDALGASVSSQGVWIVLVLVCVSALLWFLFERTWLGRAMRATSENPRGAMIVGISPRKISAITFAMAGALGAIAGALSAPASSMTYDSGLFFGLKGFAAAIIGGLGNPLGAVAGGLIMGFVEAFSAGYISSAYKDAIQLVILLLVLSIKPSGLFSRKRIERV